MDNNLNLDGDLFRFHLDGVCFEILLRPNHIQGLNTRWKMRPPDHFPGLDIEPGPVDAALNDVAVDQLPLFQGCEHMGAPALDGKKTLLQVKDDDGFSLHITFFPAARRDGVFIAHKPKCHDRSFLNKKRSKNTLYS